ncbi:hypothetical protein CL621_01485 [archaeon]|nr:hypothetical protein [archaeon]|tara:strand:- start:2410 stop:3180 length:771 start_codon:yes stop_codon:yes gene_type:complete
MGTLKYTTKQFIEQAKTRNTHDFDYSRFVYTGTYGKSIVVCSKHGKFLCSANNILNNRGCPKCKFELLKQYSDKQRLTIEDFTERVNKIHDNKYDYSKVIYKNNYTKICIICPQHGEFWQSPNKHLYRKQGCPICKSSHAERRIILFLDENNVTYERQKRYKNCRNKKPLPFDFYIPNKNILIEYDGELHYRASRRAKNQEKLKQTQLHDKIKSQFASDNNIDLIRIPYWEKDKVEKILETTLFSLHPKFLLEKCM